MRFYKIVASCRVARIGFGYFSRKYTVQSQFFYWLPPHLLFHEMHTNGRKYLYVDATSEKEGIYILFEKL